MSTLTYKCPTCGAPLVYQGDQQMLNCGSCDNSFTGEAVRKVNEIEQQDAASHGEGWDMQEHTFTGEEAARTRTFQCSSCGAQLFTDETTVATNCAFCGSPSIIPAQFTPGTRPDRIIPFLVEKNKAESIFHNYFKGRKLLPNLFLRSANRIEEIRQLYVPFWLFSCRADGRMTFQGTRVSTMRQGQYMVTTTRHFLIRRAGTLDFQDLPVDASALVHNDITETLEPFHVDQAIPFSPEVLSGAMADRAGISPEESKRRANQRIDYATEATLRGTVSGYNSVSTRSKQINIDDGVSTPALFPIWVITTKKEGKLYTFAINGQTAELTCDIPWSKAKFLGWMVGIGLGIAAVAYAAAVLALRMGVIK